MPVVTHVNVVIAKIQSEDCVRREDLDDEFSLYFSRQVRKDTWVFQIPRPLKDDGYTDVHLNVVEVQLARLGLDLLPLDQNLLS